MKKNKFQVLWMTCFMFLLVGLGQMHAQQANPDFASFVEKTTAIQIIDQELSTMGGDLGGMTANTGEYSEMQAHITFYEDFKELLDGNANIRVMQALFANYKNTENSGDTYIDQFRSDWTQELSQLLKE